jgi:type I restriction enzyme S subunit
MKNSIYNLYKSTDIEWLDKIPESWNVRRLKEVSTIFGRIGYRGYTQADIVDFEEGAITVSPSNMRNGKLVFDKNTYISWDKYEESPEIKLESGDVIMVKTGSTIGKVSYATSIDYPSTINPQLMIFKKIKCHKPFLFYYLWSSNFQSLIPLYNTGSTIPTMTQEGIGRLPIPIPSMVEQQAIANFLDKEVSRIDTLLAKKQQFIERLKEKRLALISFTITKGIDGNEELKQSGILWVDQIPLHWKTGKLKWYSLIYSGGTPDKTIDEYWEEGTVPWINSGSVNQRVITTPSAFITQEALLKSSAKWIPQNALVMALAGQGKTKGMVAQLAIKTTCNQSMAAIIPDNRLNPRYLMFWLEINYQNIRNLAGGDQRDGLNLSMIGSIECILPPLGEQNAIVELIDRIDIKHEAIISKTDEAVQKLQEYKTALISAAVTGKIKVTDQV